jgi:hypothetical protein
MRKLMRGTTVILALSVALAAVAGVVGVEWKDRADEICREEMPLTADGYSIAWDWGEFAYECDYRGRSARPKRIGVIDAFHGDGRRGH